MPQRKTIPALALLLAALFFGLLNRHPSLSFIEESFVSDPTGRGGVPPPIRPRVTELAEADATAHREEPAHARRRDAAAPTETLVFNTIPFSATTNAAALFNTARARLLTNESLPALIGLRSVPNQASRTSLAKEGIELLSYIPDRGWIARIRGGGSAADWSRDNVRIFQRLDSSTRVAANVLTPCDCDRVPLYVHVLPGSDATACVERWRTAGVEVSEHHAGDLAYIAARVAKNALAGFVDRIAHDDDVLLVERGFGARLLNDNSMRILQSGSYTGSTPVFARGIYASNQVIAVCDTGLDVDNCYFRDTNGTLPPTNRVSGTNVNWSLRKVIAADFIYAGDDQTNPLAWDNHGHGTHVSGDALGSSLSDPLGTYAQNGMAPGAKLIIQDAGYTGTDFCGDLIGLGCPVTNFLPVLEQAYAQGARIHNNSWGDNEDEVYQNRNWYTQSSRELDLASWLHRDFLVVCAAGNDGAFGTGEVLSPSNAKNSLSVAATEAGSGATNIAAFSSRGWAADGRIKPDLAAPGGFSITAASSDGTITSSNCTTTGGAGTSYASPMIAGLSALVRDYFTQGFYPSGAPVATSAFPFVSSALVKATLYASCRAMTGVGPVPSIEQGWGKPNLSLGLSFTDTVHRLVVADVPPRFAETPAQPFTLWLNVRSTNAPLKIVLVWTDYPGTAGAGKQLVNDLDLVVRMPDGFYHGNVLSGSVSGAGSGFDRTNNTEQVFFPTPSTGMVEVSVWPFVIPQATQAFAVVATGDIEEIPKSRDADADGLPDYWEFFRYGNLATVTATNDLDGDGANELAECVAGTDPTNALSRLAFTGIALETNAAITATFPSVAGRAYSILSGSEPATLAESGVLIAGTPGTNPVFSIADTNTSLQKKFGLRAAAP